MKARSIISAIAIVAFLAADLPAQKLVVRTPGAADSVRSYPSGTLVASSFRGGSLLCTTSLSIEAPVRLIVRFGAAPLLNRKAAALSAASAQRTAEAIGQLAARVPRARVTRRFAEVFDGAAVTATREDISRIRALPGVTAVVEDLPVVMCAETGSPAFSPPPVDGIGTVIGGGVRIGILDTGIDYLHEALGGGYGPGFKVSGGHDFVNHDDDPMDDNGHGTHVAGIVAGSSSSLHGTAPGATIYAYKVLDASGNGYMSDVIAAIEQAVRDSVQVLNVSLSAAGGDPSDPLSEAVDAAVRSGIVVLAAAGNSGGFGTIGSPGAAELALTVGAEDDAGGVAAFSSRGPTLRLFGLKPDIVAPGTGILSAKLHGGYVKMSGTSMAAPFVAGIAADLRQIHPDWSPEEIVGAVAAASRDLHAGCFSQGHGAIDTTLVEHRLLLTAPSSLSYGFDTPGLPTFVRTDTFVVVNRSSRSKSVSMSVPDPTHGFAMHLSSSHVTLSAGESIPVAATLVADNAALADNVAIENGYSGSIRVTSDTDTTSLPFIFFKGNAVQLTFDERPMQVVLTAAGGQTFGFTPIGTSLTAVVPPGTYDIITRFFGDAYVVREEVRTPTTDVLSLSHSEAVDTVSIEPTDDKGNTLSPGPGSVSFTSLEALLVRGTEAGEVVTAGGPVRSTSLTQRRAFSPFSQRLAFACSYSVQYGNSGSYIYDVAIDSGLAGNHVASFLPSDLKRIDFKYDVDSTITRIFPIAWSSLVAGTTLLEVSYYNGNDEPLTYPFTQTSYHSRQPSGFFPIFHRREAYKY